MEYRILSCDAVVVGAGAAGLNAADELKKAKADVLLVADSFGGGTSLNAGSDKQTYYKLSLSGDRPDSAAALAESFFAGGGTHGDIAYAMAAGSARAFLKLVQLGVPFPHNEWGEYVGYQTDHDSAARATSAGPLTSKMMVEALWRSVRARGVRVAEGLSLVSILTDDSGAARGLLMRSANAKEPLVLIKAKAIVLCTGGPAEVYGRRVFPDKQMGATGAAIRAGAAANNLCYWQYGLASTIVKWNVSGSYQQAIPLYTDGTGDILQGAIPDTEDRLSAIFLKGYQWPFDGRKVNASSRVDMAVQAALNDGKCVYLDFRRTDDVMDQLTGEARAYLLNCAAIADRPFDRLLAINEKAVAFYISHGIDLSKEPLEIALCAQHANGGLKIDAWWRTTVDGLYAAGECAGAFGIYRPGGSALNETQVGSLRAAQHIAAHRLTGDALSDEAFVCAVGRALEAELSWLRRASERLGEGESKARELLNQSQGAMDAHAGAVREVKKMSELRHEVNKALKRIETSPPKADDLSETIRLRDVLATQRAALSAMLCQSGYEGGAGHIVTGGENQSEDAARYAFETVGDETRAVPVRPLPEGGGWFETVWRRYQNGAVYGE